MRERAALLEALKRAAQRLLIIAVLIRILAFHCRRFARDDVALDVAALGWWTGGCVSSR